MREEERDLKRFMYANLYHHPRQLAAADQARGVVAGLFAAYRADPAPMPGEWPERLPPEEPGRSRHIADFIAGMTDRYAIARYREVVGPIDLPEGVLDAAARYAWDNCATKAWVGLSHTWRTRMADASIALNRFGLGARPDESIPDDPKGWLKRQIEAFEPKPAAFAAVPTARQGRGRTGRLSRAAAPAAAAGAGRPQATCARPAPAARCTPGMAPDASMPPGTPEPGRQARRAPTIRSRRHGVSSAARCATIMPPRSARGSPPR